MTHHGNFPLRAVRDTVARGNDPTVHNTPHLAARHKTVATSRGETPASRLTAFAEP